tara:strand:- start:184 stop:828 length:645 start_codon:yes stop_codon:yes gene_type:complete
MDEDLSIINTNTRNEKIKNFFLKNKKKLIAFLLVFILILISFFGYKEFKKRQKIQISNLYNSTILSHSKKNRDLTISNLEEIILKKDTTYSPLSLYFIIDNGLIDNSSKINSFFDILINETPLEKEIRNLVIYKKGLYNADQVDENTLINILNPIINSESVWRSHGLYLLAEYFYSKNEKKKSKEFFETILKTENANQNLIIESQKRLSRDLSE